MKNISHKRQDKSIEAKAKWFRSLSIEERMEIFCEFSDMILENNSNIVNSKNAKPTAGRVQVLSIP
jgi:hypothetical protein